MSDARTREITLKWNHQTNNRRGMDYSHLPVHRDQLRAQHSVWENYTFLINLL